MIDGGSAERAVITESAETRDPVELTDSIVGRSAKIGMVAGPAVQLSVTVGDATQV